MKTILLVEDDPIIIQVYRSPLKNAGFHVEVAEDGLTAMRIIPELRPDLIILDIVMPKVEGTYVLKFVRSRPEMKFTKVIVLSSVTKADIASDIPVQNPDRIFIKSQATPKIILQAIKELLGGDPTAPSQSS